MSRSASETAAALRLIAILQPDQSRGANLNREGGEMDSKTRDLERAQDNRGKHFVNSQLYSKRGANHAQPLSPGRSWAN